MNSTCCGEVEVVEERSDIQRRRIACQDFTALADYNAIPMWSNPGNSSRSIQAVGVGPQGWENTDASRA